MADACVFEMNLPDEQFDRLLGSNESTTGRFEPPLVNVGVGEDITIARLAETVKQVVGYSGNIVYDTSKPDGTMRKLLDVGLLRSAGWTARTTLEDGLKIAYSEFSSQIT